MRKGILCVTLLLLLYSCAKRSTPEGGEKDEIPPKVLSSKPENSSINFNEKKIRITFDEYIKLEKLNSQLVVSPPIDKSNYSIFPQGGASKHIDIEINDELEEIREEYKADRVWIAQFHNGGNFYPTGKSIQKFSIFYEVTKAGVSSVSHTFNNIPCSLYPKAFEHMMEGQGIFIPNFSDPKIATYGLKGAAESVGTKSSFLVPLFTLDDKYIGTIGIDYVTKKKKLTKDQWEHFQIKAGRIAGYLSKYLSK